MVAGGPKFVEGTRRATETMEYLFLLDHSADVPAAVPVPPDGTDLISGTRVSGPLTLPPLAVAVVAYQKRGSAIPGPAPSRRR